MAASVRSHNRKTDYYDWPNRQAEALRLNRQPFLDWENLAEELEAMSARERRELISHLRILMAHLLKWKFQHQRRGETSWERSFVVARQEIAGSLADSPSLKPLLDECAAKAYQDARRLAGSEMKLQRQGSNRLFPASCPWLPAQLLDDDFLPSPAVGEKPRG